jgi:hypothetical protein
MSAEYKGRFIDPKINELADGSGWTAEVYIAERDGIDMNDTGYSFQGVYQTKEAALDVAIQGAMDLIDGKIRPATV